MAPNILINHQEHRLRAFWRLLIQFIIFVAGMLITNIIAGILIALLTLSSGGNPTDPQTINRMMSYPLLRTLGAVGSLLSMGLSYLIVARWVDKRPFRGFGFHFSPRWWKDFGFGLFLGAILMVFIYGVESAMGWITITGTMQSFQPGVSFWTGIVVMLIVYFCVGIYEEMLSRGYQLRNLAEGFSFINPKAGLLIAYLLSSSVFGLLHLGNPNSSLVSTVNLIVAGLFLGLAFVLTGELAIPIGIHMTWNFFQGNVFGFPVSGGATSATFIAIQQGGPDLWTGGAFGPEAGLIGLAAMLLGSLLIAAWVKMTHGELKLKDSLAIYETKSAQVGSAETGLPEALTGVAD